MSKQNHNDLPVSVRLSEKQLQRLREEARDQTVKKKENVGVSRLIREAICDKYGGE